jgi:hypothetical protein
MHDLQDYVWMRQQWRRFRHVLIGALSAVLVLCTSGLLLRGEEGIRSNGSTPVWH